MRNSIFSMGPVCRQLRAIMSIASTCKRCCLYVLKTKTGTKWYTSSRLKQEPADLIGFAIQSKLVKRSTSDGLKGSKWVWSAKLFKVDLQTVANVCSTADSFVSIFRWTWLENSLVALEWHQMFGLGNSSGDTSSVLLLEDGDWAACRCGNDYWN